ncbi:MAG: DNA replication and repair protein RecF [Gemmatimonadales bacterium]|nr:MAG: DNA replication and repair protein RecF [Gemmatimonadales bacterium]
MTLHRLRLQGFRNLEDATLELPAEGVALVGANAQGKSNFLEAIHYLEIFRSCRGTRDTRLIRFGEDFFRLEARIGPGASSVPEPGGDAPRSRSVAAAVQRAGPIKKVTVDGEEPPRIGDALGEMGSVLFTPDDVRLVADGPQERRRFLDIVLSVNAPGYLEALQRYRQVLAQRNAALRDRAPRATVEAWDPLLAGAGARVLRMRAAWVRAGAPTFRSVVEEVSGGERGVLAYQPGVPGGPGAPGNPGTPGSGAFPAVQPDEHEAASIDAPWGDWFAGALREGLEADRRRGTTLIGPHRDEFTMGLEPDGEDPAPKGGRDLREYGSGGQKRTAALALRILEAETVLRRRGRPALLLLDDVFAELDADRSERVLGLLDRTAAGQVVLTAPKDADVRFRHDRLPRWRISGGRIETGGEGG